MSPGIKRPLAFRVARPVIPSPAHATDARHWPKSQPPTDTLSPEARARSSRIACAFASRQSTMTGRLGFRPGRQPIGRIEGRIPPLDGLVRGALSTTLDRAGTDGAPHNGGDRWRQSSTSTNTARSAPVSNGSGTRQKTEFGLAEASRNAARTRSKPRAQKKKWRTSVSNSAPVTAGARPVCAISGPRGLRWASSVASATEILSRRATRPSGRSEDNRIWAARYPMMSG
jgi:hypothetical protein